MADTMPLPSADIFAYPQWSTPIASQQSLLIVASVLAVSSFTYAAWRSRQEQDFWPLFIFFGAGLCVFYEPLGDILTKVAYPPLDELQLFHAFGRAIPLWMAPNYFFFFCVPVLLVLRYVVYGGVTKRRWWLTYLGLALFVGIFEQPGIISDAWRYYGKNQAFSINTYPVWVAFVNAQSIFVMATAVFSLRRLALNGFRGLLIVPFMPVLLVASHVGISVAIATALYSTNNLLIVNAAALTTIAMCFASVWLCFRVVTANRDALPERST